MVILEEGNLPTSTLILIQQAVPLAYVEWKAPSTAQCARGAERKIRRLAEEEFREITERAFQAYGEPLVSVMAFMYMVRLMMVGDDDWPTVVVNLQKARKSWGCLLRILIREWSDMKVSGDFSRR